MYTYDDKTKQSALQQLKTKSATAVAASTGIDKSTLRKWAKASGIKVPDGRTKAKAAAPASNGSTKRSRRRRKKAEVIDSFDGPSTEPVVPAVASLDTALAEIERAGRTIRAIREAHRRVFGA